MPEKVHAGRSADAKDAKNAADTYGRHHTGENALEMIERINKEKVGSAAAKEARPAASRKIKLENGKVVDDGRKGAPRASEANVALKPRTSDVQPEAQPQEDVTYEALSDEDKSYLVDKVTDELNEIHATHATAENHVYNRRVGELKQALLRDGGLTKEQADEIIEEAKDQLYGDDDSESEHGEPTPHDASAPSDADANVISRMTDREKERYAKFTSDDYTKKNKEAKIDKVVSKSEERASLIERAKWFTLKGGVIFSAISAVDRFRENRSEKFQRKIEGMTVAERKTAIEKKEKWTKRALYLGAGAASLYYLGSRGHVLNYAGSGLSWVNDHTFHFGSHEGGSPIDANDGKGGDDKKGAGSFRVADEAASGNIMKYHNTDAQFFDFAHKQHHGDMGPSLIANTDHAKDTVNGVYLPGYADWMERNKSNPTGLANLVSGLKLDGHGDTFTDRNQLANTLHGDPNAQMKYDERIQNALKDPKQFKVEEFKITTPYRTTYGYEVNGREMIGNEEHVDYGGTAFKITDSKGVTTYWRKDCGGYQQIWLEPRPAPVQVQQQQYVQPTYNYVAPQQSTHTETVRTVTPGKPDHTETVRTVTPPKVNPPEVTPPTVTPPTVKPPTLTPKTDHFPANDGATQLGSGALKVPDNILQSVTGGNPGRNTGGGNTAKAVIDSSTSKPGSESGVTAPGRSTGNSGIGNGGAVDSKATSGGGTNSGKVSGF